MKLDIKLDKPIHNIHPQGWKDRVRVDKLDYAAFRNLTHFKNYVSRLTQIDDMKCGVSYEQAVEDLLKNKSQLEPGEYESIRNLVRTNLLKRGLISENVYESFKYDIDGIAVDVSKVIAEDPQCMLKPMYSYTNYFYELYVNISYPYRITDAEIRENMCKLLATIEELERQHIFIKVTIVDCSQGVTSDRDLITVLPVFSHRDHKSIEIMSAVLNERLLRKFMFAMSEDIYEDDLDDSYGKATELPDSIRPVDLDECELFEEIYSKVITQGERE